MAAAVLLFIATVALIPVGSGDPENELSDIDIRSFVPDAISHVQEMRSSGWSGFPPLGASSIIRSLYLNGGNTVSLTRTDPIPTNWDLVGTFTYSRVYVEDGLTVSQGDIDAIGAIFDENIYPNATYWFHPSNPYTVINIRIYDFGDGPGNVGGYFLGSPVTRDDLFVDSEDLGYSREWTFEIVAHEFQHLLHFDLDPNEDVWLNEGLADLSARVCLGPGTDGIQSHIDAYELHPENDLLTWDEGEPPDYIDTIADYGRAYAFVSYLADHYGGRELISDLVADSRNSISSIDAVLQADGYQDRFGNVLSKEKVANLLDDTEYGGGIYDQGLIDIGIRSLELQTGTYPVSHTITSAVRYSGYYMKFTSGAPGLMVSIDSSSPVETVMVGMAGGTIASSVNLSNGGSGDMSHQLSGFGVDIDMFYVIPHTSVSGAAIDITIDPSGMEPPVTEISISPPVPDGLNGWYLSSPGIQLLTDPGSSVFFSFDGAPEEEFSATIHPPEGVSTLRFHAVGPYGSREEERELVFKVDTVDPETTIEIDPGEPGGSNGYHIEKPMISLFTLSQNDTPFYDIGDGPVEYDGPFQLDEGDWTLRYWSVDPAGRRDKDRSEEVLVDISDPILSVVLDPARPDGDSGYYRTRPTIMMDFDGGATGWLSLNGGPPVEYFDPFELEDGEWELIFFAAAPSGRTSPEIREFLKVDSKAPDLASTFDPPLCDGWCTEPTYLILSTNEGSADLLFILDGEGPFKYSSPVLLSDGEYEVSFWAADTAGNLNEGGTFDVRIDATEPVTELVLDRQPDRESWYYDEPPVLGFRTLSTPISPEMTFFSLDGEDFEEFIGQDIPLSPGRNIVHFYSIDMAGNRERTRTRNIGLDLSPPDAVLSANRTLIPVSGPVRFSIEGSTDDIEVYRFKLDFGDGTSSDWIYGTETNHDYTELGKYTAALTLEDAAGRTNDAPSTLRIEVLTQEEYDRRIRDDGVPIPLVITVILLIVIALMSMTFLTVLILHRRRNGPENDEDLVWDEI